MTDEERREMMRSNWKAQMNMLGYDESGNPKPEDKEKTMTLELQLELQLELTEEQKNEICGYKHPRQRILTLAVPMYEHEYSKYPEKIRVSFGDGHTAVYDMHIEQPHPVIEENIRIIRKWKQGYVNNPERRRRRNRT